MITYGEFAVWAFCSVVSVSVSYLCSDWLETFTFTFYFVVVVCLR